MDQGFRGIGPDIGVGANDPYSTPGVGHGHHGRSPTGALSSSDEKHSGTRYSRTGKMSVL